MELKAESQPLQVYWYLGTSNLNTREELSDEPPVTIQRRHGAMEQAKRSAPGRTTRRDLSRKPAHQCWDSLRRLHGGVRRGFEGSGGFGGRGGRDQVRAGPGRAKHGPRGLL